jgi:hypothetical protein
MASLIAQHWLMHDAVEILRIPVAAHSAERQIIVKETMWRCNAADPRGSIAPSVNSKAAGIAPANFS